MTTTLGILAIAGVARFAGLAQAPEIRLLSATSQVPQSVPLSFRPYSSDWVLLEASSDLIDWRPVANLLTTNSSGPFVDYPPAESPARFYRVRRPGVSAATASNSWQAVRPVHYRYRFQNWKLEGGRTAWAGTVTVSNGVKRVSDVTANEHLAANHDPGDFLSPGEVFAFLANVESQGVKLAHVAYDDRWNFATSVVVVPGTPNPIIEFHALEFVDLSEESGEAGDQAAPSQD